jgi:hypothetical protein
MSFDDDLIRAVQMFEAAGHTICRNDGEPAIFESFDEELGYDTHPRIMCSVCNQSMCWQCIVWHHDTVPACEGAESTPTPTPT